MHRLDSDAPAGADAVLDHHLLLPHVSEPIADEACGEVGGAADGEGDDHLHRLGWEILRCGVRCAKEQCGDARRRNDTQGGLLLLAPVLPFGARWWKRRRP